MNKFNDIISVKGLFFSMAFYVGLWSVRIPTIKNQLNTDYLGIGFVFTTFAIGSLLAMIVANYFIKKYSSKFLIVLAMIIQALLWLLVAFINSIEIFMILSFAFGICFGIFEVAINLQASKIEVREKKSMMSGFHVFWSLGILFGAILTSLFLQWQIAFFNNIIIYLVFLIPISFLCSINLGSDSFSTNSDKSSIFFVWPTLIFLLVLLSIGNALVEGGVDSWGALYMKDIIGVNGFNIGIATISFNISMVIGRFTGDYLRDKLGVYIFINILLFFVLIGIFVLLYFENLFSAIIGFSILGLGISSIVPLAYSLAGKVEGIESAVGITIISISVYGIFLVAPAALGILANLYGVSFVFVPMFVVSFICILTINLYKNKL
ncbi:MFS transporter [Alphaproteobacteria bacterium]|nr:MFS transporter [Alphaproteobacteria bacterium]